MSSGSVGGSVERTKAEARARRFCEGAYYEPTGGVLDDPVERKKAEVRAQRFGVGN